MIVLLKKNCCIEIKQIDLTLKTMKGYKRAVLHLVLKKIPTLDGFMSSPFWFVNCVWAERVAFGLTA
jgi:hypothetical protein